MKQVLLRAGEAIVEEVPVPVAQEGIVLVRVDHSCISIGTELSGLQGSGLPLWKRAIKQPDNVKKAVQMMAAQGISRTWSAIEGKLGSGNATGYSVAGTVAAVGAGVTDFAPGDRVACAGAQYAHHAEYVAVPKNLVVPVPDALSFAEASTVTLGAIALQGVRRAQPTLGETFTVIGLGVLGQITVQLLKANGCRVIGIDLDRKRIETALSLGMDHGLHPDDGNDISLVASLTDGIGADGVIITAASPSDAIISTAFQFCRRKGRVVLVGDVGLNLNRADFYQKELDFFISTSYGPGRYDNNYEERGYDYPVAYVRWTENRNLAEYLRLAGEGHLRIKPLLTKTFPVDEAPAAYREIKQGADRPLLVLLNYPHAGEAVALAHSTLNPRGKAPPTSRVVRLALVGAGDFAKGMHLPNLRNMPTIFHLRAVMSRTAHNAKAIATQFEANYATTDFEEVLRDPEVDAVLLTTRHNLHASLALAALKAGKHVLVEKPLALNRAELQAFAAFYADKGATGAPLLMTMFNRRFSAYGRFLHAQVAKRINPMMLTYRMNAGHIPRAHWVHTAEGGGRNIGEACHIYDLFTYLTGSKVVSVRAASMQPRTGHLGLNDNFSVLLGFEDGSVATLTYTAAGAREHPKEQLEVFVDGRTLVLDDYKRAYVKGAKAKEVSTQLPEKGQKEALEAFGRAILRGDGWPIPLWQQTQAMEIAFQVEEQIGNV